MHWFVATRLFISRVSTLPAMNVLDDLAVVTSFVKGDQKLNANQDLKFESAFNSVRLLARRGGLIGTINYDSAVPTARVRSSEYWELVNRVLLENCFMPLGADSAGFHQYRKVEVPPDYSLQVGEAKMLWREWWKRNRHNPGYAIHPSSSTIQMDLLVFVRNTWYPIRDITPDHERLFISTLATEVQLSGKDLIAWLSRTANAESNDRVPQATPTGNTGSAQLAATAHSNATTQTDHSTTRRLPPPPRPSLEHLQQVSGKSSSAVPVAVPMSARSKEISSASTDLRHIVRMVDGKLYINTAIGEIVVEGESLTFWLSTTSRSGAA